MKKRQMKQDKIISKLINYYVNDQKFNNLCSLIIKKVIRYNVCYCELIEYNEISSIYYNDIYINVGLFKFESFLHGIENCYKQYAVNITSDVVFFTAGQKAGQEFVKIT